MDNNEKAGLKNSHTDFFNAAAGLYSYKAIMAFATPWVLFMLIVFAMSLIRLGSGVTVFQVLLLAVFAFIIGWSAAGGVLMDLVRGKPEKSLKRALITGVYDALRVVAALILASLVFLLWLVGVGVVLTVCKIPVIGPFLFAISSPVLALGTGIAVIGLIYGLVLVPPAIWDSKNSVTGLTQFIMLVRTKLPVTLIQVSKLLAMTAILLAIFTLITNVGSILFNIISLPIVQASIGLAQLGFSFFTKSGSSAYNIAGLVGWMLLAALGLIAPIIISLTGACMLYLDLSEEIDTHDINASLAKGFLKTKSMAAEVQNQVAAGVHKIREQTDGIMSHHTQKEAIRGSSTCAHCGGNVLANDIFCGNCGMKIDRVEVPESDNDTKGSQ